MKLYDDTVYVKAQGQLFAQIIQEQPQAATPLLTVIAEKALKGDLSSQKTLGNMAFRSSYFQKFALVTNFKGDMIQHNYWKKSFKKIIEDQKTDPSYILGISEHNFSFVSQITYQFVHGSLFHLISNLWFLMIFGSFLERFWGSLSFIIFYLLSGIMAAVMFVFMSGISEAPLIGASGSISGLMGLILVLFWDKKIKCFYWVLPKIGYSGIKKFPAWVVFCVWIVSDITGYLGTMEEFGGVAHAAHLGGFAFGALVGLIVRFSSHHQKGQSLSSSYSR